MQAIWQGTVLADSDDTVVVEGNHYFPADSLAAEHFSESQTHSECGWKGTASYYNVTVDGQTNADAAFYYPKPMAGAEQVADRVAFWKGVEVVDAAG
jgi:uncharacterized protein (DUF427 family)